LRVALGQPGRPEGRGAPQRLLLAVLAERHGRWMVASRRLGEEALEAAPMTAIDEKEVAQELRSASWQ